MTLKNRIRDSLLWALNHAPGVPKDSRFSLVPRDPWVGWYAEDAVRSVANHGFVDEPAFVKAYDRGVSAAGWDFKIRWRVHVALWAAAAGARIPGDFVECGVGRGMVSSAVLESLPWEDLEKRFWLIDTFLPYWTDAEGAQPESGEVSPYYASGLDDVTANFAEWSNIKITPGRIPEVLEGLDIGAVAYLHIDLNAAAPERAALAHFWPLLVPGALVLFDDYGFGGEHVLQKIAIDEFAAKVGAPVLTLPTGQGLMVKES